MKESANSKIHISSNFLLSIRLLIQLDNLLLAPSLHFNTSLPFTTLHPTTLHCTYRHFTYSHLHFTTLSFGLTHLHFLLLFSQSPISLQILLLLLTRYFREVYDLYTFILCRSLVPQTSNHNCCYSFVPVPSTN
jgi:hypothetical protein